MNVVWYQGPGVAWCLGIRKVIRQSLDKLIAVVVVAKDLTLFDTPDDDVVKCPGGIYACFTRHKFSLAAAKIGVNLFIYLWMSPFSSLDTICFLNLYSISITSKIQSHFKEENFPTRQAEMVVMEDL
jgi:hypothetical protein